MKLSGCASLSAFLGDRILYRNIIPADSCLPGLPQLRGQLDINASHTPRKTSMDYARVVYAILQTAQKMRSTQPLSQLILIGDTQLNDGTAFANLTTVSGWNGVAFIGSEKTSPERFDLKKVGSGALYTANRWTALKRFDQVMTKHHFPVNENTTILIDIDKTALGARGRNDALIDQARLEAACTTASDALGKNIDLQQFQKDYQTLNQPEFHSLTTDNQDILVYICMMINYGPININQLLTWMRTQKIASINDFIKKTEAIMNRLPKALCQTHSDFYNNYTSGDPTPFKAFRRREYLATVNRMGILPNNSPMENLLKEEIVITGEVYQFAMHWAAQGALLFGISDKPDEASIPTPDQAAAGFRPIHQTTTHIIGA